MQIQFKQYQIILLILTLSCLELAGCAYRMAYGECSNRVKTGECNQKFGQDIDITAANSNAVDNLMHYFPTRQFQDLRILVTTIADIDDLNDSTSFGRLVGEQVSARLTQTGLTVIEAKFYQGLSFIPRTGEFILSRELREWGQIQRADVFVAGTYAVGKNMVYVTLKMLNFKDSRILSSYAYALPIGPNTLALLQKNSWW